MVSWTFGIFSSRIFHREIVRKKPFKLFHLYRHRQYTSVAMGTAVKQSPNVIEKVYNDIIKSEQDKRQYRGLLLQNGMKVLLVSDSTTDKSSAALDVHIGFMKDPKNLPGLAHFLEHMLFMGTEKYPCENEYNKFLSMHSGSSNAYTASDHTNFFFDVSPEHLSGAIDRFAQFFICPLFTESGTDREVKAVNSEHEKNIQADAWRLNQLEKATSDPDHDFSKFGTGNIETLDKIPKSQGINVRKALLEFHDRWYSANIMSLAVLGKESLDELTELVVNLFSEVKNKNVSIPEWNDHPFRDEDLRLKGLAVPVKDIRNLNVTFPIPDLHPHYRSGPGRYLGHLIGHEGPGSLLSELKSRGWVNTLGGGHQPGANGFGFFIVSVDLTEEGINHVDDIVSLMFQYFNMLKREQPKKWIFEECKNLAAMMFRFKDKERPQSYTSSLSTSLHDYDIKEVLSGPYLLHEYKPDLIESVLEKLTPENVRLAVISKKFESETDREEKWYGTKYKLERIDSSLIESWKQGGHKDTLKLPEVNEFIAVNFDLAQREESSSLPRLIKNSEMSRVWFKQDDEFLLPKSVLYMEFMSPLAYVDPLRCNMTYMFVQLLKDALNEYTYAATLAGLSYNLNNSKYGMFLNVKGYNDKQGILLDKVMDCLTNFKIDPKRFEILKEKYVRGIRNFQAEQPHQHAIYYMSTLLSEHAWTKENLLEATEDLTVERLESFIPDLLCKMYIEALAHGNLTEKQALDLVGIVEKKLEERTNTKPLCSNQLVKDREVQLTDGSNYRYVCENVVHSSSCIESYYQCGLQDIHSNVLVELYVQIISEPCFNILRTQQQLGYIVFSGVRRLNGAQGIHIIVQSDRDPSYLDNRIEAFLVCMQKHISEMSDEDFEQNKRALIDKRLEKPKKLVQQSIRYWSEISSRQYNFDRDTIEVENLKSVTKEQISKFHEELLSYDSPKRRKLSVHVVSTAPGAAERQDAADNLSEQPDGLAPAPNLSEASTIEDITAFKTGLPLFPLVQPFIRIPPAVTKSKL